MTLKLTSTLEGGHAFGNLSLYWLLYLVLMLLLHLFLLSAGPFFLLLAAVVLILIIHCFNRNFEIII